MGRVRSNSRRPNKRERKGKKKLNPHEAISRRFCGHCTVGQTTLLISFQPPVSHNTFRLKNSFSKM